MWFVFSVFDKAAEEYGQLYMARNETVGIRMFTDAVNTPNGETMLRLHPEDYEMVSLGQFDEETGQLIQGDIRTIAKAKDLVREGSDNGR